MFSGVIMKEGGRRQCLGHQSSEAIENEKENSGS